MLKSNKHTSSHYPIHDGKTTEGHDECSIQPRKQIGQHIHIEHPKLRFLHPHQHLRAVTSPFHEKVGLSAVGFDAVDHGQTIDGCTIFLAGILLNAHG